MIITRTPFRVSFFGGGSDMAAFYKVSTGAVLSTSIDRYMYISVHPYFDPDRIHVKYSQMELVGTPSELRHPIVRRVLERLGGIRGVEIASTADVPSGTGLGSSSAFTVGLLNVTHAYCGRSTSPARLAADAVAIEVDDLASPIGKQDQCASAHGGLNFIRFFADESVDVAPLVISRDCRSDLQASLLMFYTGDQRSANAVLSEQRDAVRSDAKKFSTMKRMVELAFEAKSLLESSAVESFGRLLHEAWQLKRSLTSGISSGRIDEMYDVARRAGAWGGKLLGAGGGGFLLVAAAPDRHAAIRQAMAGCRELPIRFDHGGSKVVYMSEDA